MQALSGVDIALDIAGWVASMPFIADRGAHRPDQGLCMA